MKTKEADSLTYQKFYFDLLADIADSVTDVEQILRSSLERLRQIADIPFGAIYVYHQRVQQFRLMYYQTDNAQFHPLQIVEKKSQYAGEDVLQEIPLDYEVEIIQLKQIDDVKILFVFSFMEGHHPFSEKASFIKETEKFLSIIIPLINNKENNHNHAFLYELSARLFSKNAQIEILTEIVDALKICYPSYTYSLLLSQDSDAGSLPIKMIQYTDEEEESKSTLAFRTGELQIEVEQGTNIANIYAPLAGNQAIYGVLQITIPVSTYFPRKSLEFITQFANLAGIALERITLYQNSKEQVSSLSFVNEFARRLNSNLEIDEITKLVKNEIINLCHASQVGFIFLNDEIETEYHLLTESTGYFRSETGSAFIAFLMEKIKTDRELIFSGNFANRIALPYHSVMAIPINHADSMTGLAIILHEDKYYFTFENFKLIQALIQHTSLAITNTLLRDRLERMIITDYLTGLYSRNYLEESIEASFQNDGRGVLILFDIDDFKQINDTYGHHTGDEVIIQVADVMREYVDIESGHVAARWGGEELSIYLPNAIMGEGIEIATKIRKRVMAISKPRVTISCGISSWKKEEQDSTINLFLRTDKALYRAKRLGKNRIEKN